MSYTIYGECLEPGHCEVHPQVHEEYPCTLCETERSVLEREATMPNKTEEEHRANDAYNAMLEALILATRELNAIRARDGAPQHIDWHRGQPIQLDSCTHKYWNELTQQCYAAIEKAQNAKY